MKQIIVLVSMIMLGVVLVNLIVGSEGVGTTARQLWNLGYEYREQTFLEPKE